MKMKEKKVVFALIGIVVIILFIILCINIFKNSSKNNKLGQSTNDTQSTEKYAVLLDDGTKLNNSESLKSTKIYKTLEFSNIQITSINGNTSILANIKNIGSTTFEAETVKLTLLGDDDELIIEIAANIPQIEAGKTTQLNKMVTADLANIKDFKIVAK